VKFLSTHLTAFGYLANTIGVLSSASTSGGKGCSRGRSVGRSVVSRRRCAKRCLPTPPQRTAVAAARAGALPAALRTPDDSILLQAEWQNTPPAQQLHVRASSTARHPTKRGEGLECVWPKMTLSGLTHSFAARMWARSLEAAPCCLNTFVWLTLFEVWEKACRVACSLVRCVSLAALPLTIRV
jgi:hypothetical protein